MRREKLGVFLAQIAGHAVRRRGQITESPALCFPDPGVVIAVAVEEDLLVRGDHVVDQTVERALKILSLFQHVCILAQRFRHGRIDHHVRTGN